MSRPDRSFLLSAGVAQAVQRVLALAFGNKLSWFESHYRHISLCSPGSCTSVNTSLLKQTMLVRHGESSEEKRAVDLEELDNSLRRSLFQLNSQVAHLP